MDESLPPPRPRATRDTRGPAAARGALQATSWLDRDPAERDRIAEADHTRVDIVIRCALVRVEAVGLRVPAEMSRPARWFAAVRARPAARA